ncbi:DNA-dependent RNA polymerase I subunit A43 [Histoplasma capsulatum G186AR]|nr:DNA-dependent RNA polymerase I subunit A43 [Histoplasma capsulatum]QSS71335.1 DNA-dependent RNA polymerase I subunit A43 [Histoplasma capsulatum G186AR]
MSLDAMDIDSVPVSPERKRKNREKDGHSAKKRKHEVSNYAAQPEAEESSPKPKKKEKKDREHKKHKHHDDFEPSAPTLPASPNPRSQITKKHKHQSPATQDDEEEEPPTTSRKPLTKASASRLESTSTDSMESSPFHLITATLYVPLSPISISPTHALSSLQAEHLSPLLLTYFPPVRGIVLAYSNASISSTPPSPSSPSTPHNPDESPKPQPLTLAMSAGEYGVLYVYLTATFLVFRPERGQPLEGWINVQSDGFLGAVVYNLFSVGIERRRLPADWRWVAPGQESTTSTSEAVAPKDRGGSVGVGVDDDDDDDDEDKSSDFDSDKENFRPLPASSAAMLDHSTQYQSNGGLEPPFEAFEDASAGYFQTRSGRRVRGMVRFRVRDVDVIPGAEHDKGFISIEGTMLSPEEEAKLVEEERKRAGFAPSSSSSAVAAAAAGVSGGSGNAAPRQAVMSGGLGTSSASTASAAVETEEEPDAEIPVRRKKGKEKEKEKEKKKKKKEKKTTL